MQWLTFGVNSGHETFLVQPATAWQKTFLHRQEGIDSQVFSFRLSSALPLQACTEKQVLARSVAGGIPGFASPANRCSRRVHILRITDRKNASRSAKLYGQVHADSDAGIQPPVQMGSP